jgi:hypothetical protein
MSYQAENIPLELRQLPQWVCSGIDKVPINPNSGRPADPMNSATWGTFEQACKSNQPNIGFVLGFEDPYCIIDLDDKEDNPATEEQRARFAVIINAVDSYTELSQSGRGIHIVVKGAIPKGVKRDNVEIYSWGRYMIFTGNVIKQAPITDQNDIILKLYREMETMKGTAELKWIPPIQSDLEVWQMASTAENEEKFNNLWEGKWEHYPDYQVERQSGADFALLSMLCFYSRSNHQVISMFRQSGLGKREKAQRDDYLIRSIKRIRAVQDMPEIDFSKIEFPGVQFDSPFIVGTPPPSATTTPSLQDPIVDAQPAIVAIASPPPMQPGVTFPPGLVGDLAYYIYASSQRPVAHVSLAAALALCAGISGRAYNVSGSGLNHYIILVAGTGRGKEDGPKGIDRIMGCVKKQIQGAEMFIGPGAYASGQGLIKVLNNKQCFLSVLGEFGITLHEMTGRNANPALVMLRKMLLALYSKSGFADLLMPTAYSDQEKNTDMVQAPNVTLLGEGSTATFFQGLEESHILDGLLPRFTTIEYKGPRVKRNENAYFNPPQELIDRLSNLAVTCMATMNNTACAPISFNSDAKRLLDEYDTECDRRINESQTMVESELYNRAHLKALKLAGLVAVGCDIQTPVITLQIAQWAIDFTTAEIDNMARHFNVGDVGEGNHRQEHDFKRLFEQYMIMTPVQRGNSGVRKSLSEQQNVVPKNYLRKRLKMTASFKNDKAGSNRAIENLINTLTGDHTIQRVPPDQALEMFQTRAVLYTYGECW